MGLASLLKPRPEPERFAARVIAALRGAGAPEPLVYDAATFSIGVGPGSGRMYLTNLYAEYCASWPWVRRALLGRWCRVATLADQRPRKFVEARRALRPVVRDLTSLGVDIAPARAALGLDPPSEPEPRAPLASTPLGPDYLVRLVLDLGEAMAFVNEDELRGWDVPFERALEYAIDNLRALSMPASFHTVSPGLFASTWQDNYDPSRVLLPELLRALPLHGRPVVAIPNRDLLLVTGADDVPGLRALAVELAAGLEAPRPLGGAALILDDAGWRALTPRDGDADAMRALHTLAEQHRARNYAAQKEELETALGEAVFVASVLGLDEDGALDTFTTWSRDVDTLLPEAAWVALYDPAAPEGPTLFPWAEVARVCGARMERIALVPPRWRVRSFPSDEERAALAPSARPAERRERDD
jgi:hypothetical protein